MADIDTSSQGSKKKGPGVKKSQKKSLRVDLTPMVDLGFLLITFFVFTTTMSQPTGMFMNMPDDNIPPEKQDKVAETGALSILLGANNHVYYYEGQLQDNGANVKPSSFKDIRQVIIDKKRSTDPTKFMVLIKPGQESNYNNLVSIMDEMAINVVKKYALINKVDPSDEKVIQMSDAANP